MRQLALALGILGGASCLLGQEFSPFSFEAEGGFTQTVGNTGRQLNNGWNAGLGVGMNFSPWVGFLVEGTENGFGINGTTLSQVGFPGGYVRVFSATLDPIVHLTPHRHFDVYLIGGSGVYHYTQDFTVPTVATFTAYDPFFGFFSSSVPTNTVVSSYSTNKIGVDGGAGIAFGTRWHGKIFAEARYNRIFMGGNQHVDYVPVSFGFRW